MLFAARPRPHVKAKVRSWWTKLSSADTERVATRAAHLDIDMAGHDPAGDARCSGGRRRVWLPCSIPRRQWRSGRFDRLCVRHGRARGAYCVRHRFDGAAFAQEPGATGADVVVAAHSGLVFPWDTGGLTRRSLRHGRDSKGIFLAASLGCPWTACASRRCAWHCKPESNTFAATRPRPTFAQRKACWR